ncbi:hypothetical protein ROT00_12430 [Agromyces mediolanus]|uniref:hypothetical protein n=1 Tax=Agromyces mediolanus TaxID=41986 RepID=UPI003836E1CB
MRGRGVKTLAALGVSLAMVFGGSAVANAAPQTWYYITGYSQTDCQRISNQYRGLGARIVTACHKRSYDQKWAFSYYWIN